MDHKTVDNGLLPNENVQPPNENGANLTEAAIRSGYQVLVTDYFTIEIPDGWSVTCEQRDEYTFALDLSNDAGVMAATIEMLPQGATVMPFIPSDSQEEVLHEDDENGQKTIISVYCTDQVNAEKAAVIADIMSDSLKNTATF